MISGLRSSHAPGRCGSTIAGAVWLRLAVFGFGASLSAIAGIALTPIWGLRPHVGVDVVIPDFLIIVICGVGSFWGAVSPGLGSRGPSRS